jgi:hypothetical protein
LNTLLQIVQRVGKAEAACDKQIAPTAELQVELHQLLAWLIAAAHLSGHAELPQQVRPSAADAAALCVGSNHGPRCSKRLGHGTFMARSFITEHTQIHLWICCMLTRRLL